MSTPTPDPAHDVAPPDLEYKTAVLERPDIQVGTDANTTVDPDTHEVTAVIAVTGIRDDVGDVIVPGAFERTLRERPKPKVCLGHDWNKPIGKSLTVNEYPPGDANLPKTTYDGKPWPKDAGAVIARYTPDLTNEDGRNAFGSAKFFGRDESTFSFGYKTRTAKHKNNTRYLHDLDLYEYGPVLVPANRLATLQDIKSDSDGVEHAAIEPDETKVKQVRDVAYWGEPYGTPITGDMHPHGPKARAERRGGRVPSRSIGIMGGAEHAANPEKPARISPRERQGPAGLIPEPQSNARVLPHPTRAKGKDATHINSLADHVAEGGTSPEADDEERAAVDKAMHGLLDEAITPHEVSQRLAAHPALNPAERQGEEGEPNPHEDAIAHAVADYTARYQALANRQHANPVPVPGAEHYTSMSNGEVSASGKAASSIAAGMRDNGISTDHPAYQHAMAQSTGAREELQRRSDEIAAHPNVALAHQEGLAYRAKNPDLAERRATELEPHLQATIQTNQENEPKRGGGMERLPYQIQATMNGLRGQDMRGNKLPEAPKAPTSAGEAARLGIPTGNAGRDASAITIMNKERGRAMVSNMSDEALTGVDKELAGRASALGRRGQLSGAHRTVKDEIARREALKTPKIDKVAHETPTETRPYTVLSREGKRTATVDYQGEHYTVEHHGGVLGHVAVTDRLGNTTKVSGGSSLELPTNRAASREQAVRDGLKQAHEKYTNLLETDKGAALRDLANRHANVLARMDKGEAQTRASTLRDDLLGAVDTEMSNRAAALGKPGQLSPSHKIVKDELAARADREASRARALRAEAEKVTPGTGGAANKIEKIAPGGGVTISPTELDEATTAGDVTHGLIEHPDGHLEVEKPVADRQDRIEKLLGDHAAGKLDLTGKSTQDLHGHHADLTAELALQNQIARHDAANPPRPKAPTTPKAEGALPKTRPGLAGAAQDHAEALRSGNAEAIARTRTRLDSSIRRSRASSDTARTLADHVLGNGGDGVSAEHLATLASNLKTESRVKRNAAARSRRTAKRLDRERIRSVLGNVDQELRTRGESPSIHEEPGAPKLATETNRAERLTGGVRGAEPPKIEEPAKTVVSPPKPLTDEQYAAHTKNVEDTLNRELKNGHSTDLMFTKKREGKIYFGDRARQHQDIVNKIWDEHGANVPTEGRSVIAGGLGGAGKSTVLKNHANIKSSDYLTINPDDIKEEFAKRGMIPEVKGLSPMEASALVHEESSHVANMLAQRAYKNKTNVMWDITMSSKGSVDKRIAEMNRHGYSKPDAVFVDIPVETSVSRALSRHRRGMERFRNGEGAGGRYVPPNIIRKNSSSTSSSANRDVFNATKDKFGSHVVYDNSVVGREPQKITGTGRWGVGSTGLENFHASDTEGDRLRKLSEHYRFLSENGVNGPYRNDSGVRESLHSIHAPTVIGGDHEATPENKAILAHTVSRGHDHINNVGAPHYTIRNLSNVKGSNADARRHGTAAQYDPVAREISVSAKTLGANKYINGGVFSNTGDTHFHERTITHETGHHLDFELQKEDPQAHANMMRDVTNALSLRKQRWEREHPGEIPNTVAKPYEWIKKNKSKVVNRVGSYAANNNRELMAELYAEYRHSSKPSKAATIAGQYLERRKR